MSSSSCGQDALLIPHEARAIDSADVAAQDRKLFDLRVPQPGAVVRGAGEGPGFCGRERSGNHGTCMPDERRDESTVGIEELRRLSDHEVQIVSLQVGLQLIDESPHARNVDVA